jgi:hypothetical protein
LHESLQLCGTVGKAGRCRRVHLEKGFSAIMAGKTEPTQAMPDKNGPADTPRPTQPTGEKPKPKPLTDDEGFGGFMGHGGQTDISDETEEAGGNPNSTAQSD